MKYRIRRYFRAVTLLTHMYKTVTALAPWLIYECIYRHHWAEDDSWRHLWQDANQRGNNLICACISSCCLRQYRCTCIMVSLWVQQHHEQRMVPRGSNKRLTHKTIAYAKKLNTSLLQGSPVCIHICSSLSYLVIGMRWPLLTNTERNTHVHVYRLIGELFCGF